MHKQNLKTVLQVFFQMLYFDTVYQIYLAVITPPPWDGIDSVL